MKSFEQFLSDVNKYELIVTSKNLRRDFSYANGCGAKGGKKFPSAMLFVNIESACNAHDIGWQNAKSIKDLKSENEIFDNNLKLITDSESNFATAWIRRQMISYYISGVELVGTQAEADKRGFVE